MLSHDMTRPKMIHVRSCSSAYHHAHAFCHILSHVPTFSLKRGPMYASRSFSHSKTRNPRPTLVVRKEASPKVCKEKGKP